MSRAKDGTMKTTIVLDGEMDEGLRKAITHVIDNLEQLEKVTRDVEEAARRSDGGFTVMKGAMADLISDGIQGAISMVGDMASSIYGLAESTREYREDMGKLETAWESAGQSTELATDMYKQFYSVLGEEDRSVEAVNHLAQLVDTEKDMQKWTDIAAGVWGTFGDSLPIEGLTEASNETAKVGKVTGVLADALNWAGMSEDKFNEALESMNSEQERSAYITETLNDLYSDAAKNYRENNESIIDARLANSDYTDSLAEMGERIEPVTTAVQEGLNKILMKALELTEDIDFGALADKVGVAAETVIELTENGLAWLSENKDWLVPLIAGVASGFAAFKVIGTVVPLVSKLVGVFKLLQGATLTLKGVMAFISGPIGWIAIAIGAVVAAGIALYKNWDTIREKALEVGEMLGNVWETVQNAVGNMITKIGEHFPLFGAYLQGWWDSVSAAVENVKGVFSGIIDFVTNIFAGNWSAAWDNVISIFSNLFGGIVNLAKAPINGVIGMVNNLFDKINSISVDVPEWMGGGTFGFDIPKIPMLATGGFTDGISIAGEAGTEAVISFNKRYRQQNLSYWAEAGRMLGADETDFSLSGNSSGSYIDIGDVVFSPNITVQGDAKKSDIIAAIREVYPEFMDMMEELLSEREAAVYG